MKQSSLKIIRNFVFIIGMSEVFKSNYQIILVIVAEYMRAVLGVGELAIHCRVFFPTTKFTFSILF